MITRRGLAAAALVPLAVPVAAEGAAISRIAFGTCADEKLPQKTGTAAAQQSKSANKNMYKTLKPFEAI